MPDSEEQISVIVCTVSDGKCQTIAADTWGPLAPGASRDATYSWNGLGMVGDVRVTASVWGTTDDDASNNVRSVDHYVILGGLGAGVTL
jgi:hypothetical protein